MTADDLACHQFLNRCRILNSIDAWEMEQAGITMTTDSWPKFRDDPVGWMMRAGDAEAHAVWSIIRRRETPRHG